MTRVSTPTLPTYLVVPRRRYGGGWAAGPHKFGNIRSIYRGRAGGETPRPPGNREGGGLGQRPRPIHNFRNLGQAQERAGREPHLQGTRGTAGLRGGGVPGPEGPGTGTWRRLAPAVAGASDISDQPEGSATQGLPRDATVNAAPRGLLELTTSWARSRARGSRGFLFPVREGGRGWPREQATPPTGGARFESPPAG